MADTGIVGFKAELRDRFGPEAVIILTGTVGASYVRGQMMEYYRSKCAEPIQFSQSAMSDPTPLSNGMKFASYLMFDPPGGSLVVVVDPCLP
jgi:hypothetical protein